MCGINASTSQWCGYISILCYAHLQLAILLHKQGLVATGVDTTVQLFESAAAVAKLVQDTMFGS